MVQRYENYLPSPDKNKACFVTRPNFFRLWVPGIYKIPCSSGAFYIGQTGQNVQVRQKDHQSYIHQGHIVKSALAENAWTTGNTIHFEDIKFLFRSEDWETQNKRIIDGGKCSE